MRKSQAKNSRKQIVTKKVSKALKVSPVRSAAFEFSGDRRIKDAVVVTISAAGGFSRQLTIHPPIGITDCDDGDWVVSQTSDIAQLLATAKDPSAEKHMEKVRLWKVNKVIEISQAADPPRDTVEIHSVTNQLHYVGDITTRKDRISTARKTEKEANRDKAGWKPTAGSWIPYLKAEYAQNEITFRRIINSEELVKEAKEEPSLQIAFRTRYARGFHSDQTASKALTGCNRSAEVFSRVVSLLDNYEETSKLIEKANINQITETMLAEEAGNKKTSGSDSNSKEQEDP
jgi:hypothetical protein